MSEVIARAAPLPMPAATQTEPRVADAEPLRGRPQRFSGTSQTRVAADDSRDTARQAANSTGAVWPGGFNANPNRQAGRLFFWDPSQRRWGHCSATAINTANRSFVLTAGHCVYQSDPDQNGRVDGNGFYNADIRFCPGFEYTCQLGVWYYRSAATTPTWYYGVGTGRTYTWVDDVAVVLVKSNASRYLVDVVGGQGITFNQTAGQTRTAFGYPMPDHRFPGTPWQGNDLIYCQGVDRLEQTRTKIWIPCRMTGGASGGPWLSSVNSAWLGYVNALNSHKPYGANYMESPYFGQAEADLFHRYKAA